MTDKVKVTQAVYDGLEAVRKSGKTNMFDYNQVCVIANMLDFSETVVWLTANKKVYSAGVFRGFEPIEFTDEEATAAIEQAVEASETEAPKGIYPAAKTYAEQRAARASVAKQLPFADPAALWDTEDEPTTDAPEPGISEAVWDAVTDGEVQTVQDMIDDEKANANMALDTLSEMNAELTRACDTVLKQAETIEELRAEVKLQSDLKIHYARHADDRGGELNIAQNKSHRKGLQIEQLQARVAELEADRGDLLELVNDVLSMTNKPEENPVEALSLIWQITHAALKKLEEKS